MVSGISRLFIGAGIAAAVIIMFPKPAEGYDYARCIESCDMQYSACVSRGASVAYCSGQHDSCRAGCLAHK